MLVQPDLNLLRSYAGKTYWKSHKFLIIGSKEHKNVLPINIEILWLSKRYLFKDIFKTFLEDRKDIYKISKKILLKISLYNLEKLSIDTLKIS